MKHWLEEAMELFRRRFHEQQPETQDDPRLWEAPKKEKEAKE